MKLEIKRLLRNVGRTNKDKYSMSKAILWPLLYNNVVRIFKIIIEISVLLLGHCIVFGLLGHKIHYMLVIMESHVLS